MNKTSKKRPDLGQMLAEQVASTMVGLKDDQPQVVPPPKSEWRVLVDYHKTAFMMEPRCTNFAFVKVKDGVIIKRGKFREGFIDMRKELREELTDKLAALDKPFLREFTHTKLVEEKHS